MTPDLRAAIERHYALRLGLAHALSGGYECRVWHVVSTRGPLVVRLSPSWRAMDELAWVHALVGFTATAVPEVVAPLVAADGSTLFRHRRQPAALFPFIPGHPLKRTLAGIQRAARLLARLHGTMLAWPDRRPRPPTGARAPTSRPSSADSPALIDPALDAWRATLPAQPHALTTGPIHGDYYRGNLRCTAGRISGVIDWDDSAIDYLIQEVAWAAWEFTKVRAGDALHMERAQAFLAAYRAAEGPCQPHDYAHVIPFIRWRLREEVRRNRAAAERGEPWDRAYMEQEVRAFHRLRGCMLSS